MQTPQIKNFFPPESQVKENVLSEELEYCAFEDRNFLTDKRYQSIGEIFKRRTEGAALGI